MNKINKKSFLLIAIALIVVLTTCLCLFTLGSSYAGSWTAGQIDYFGSKNICEYDVIISADLAYEHKFTKSGFKVQMIGIRCERNVFTTFLYNVNFTLYEGDTEIDTRNANFKITKSSQILEDSYCPIIFESSSLKGHGLGSYKIKWSGTIKSNVTINVSGTYEFEIM